MRRDVATLVRRFGLGPDVAAAIGELVDGVEGTHTLTMDGDELSREPRGLDFAERYADLGLIARGGMGEVRRVHDRHLDRVVAMKVIHPSLLIHPHAVARFAAEARATAQLQHPGIVPVHDLGETPDGRLWFTMKEVDGRTVREVIHEVHDASDALWRTSSFGWTIRKLVGVFLQICHAVAYAHERGVVHRDLKPANAMVGRHGEVYVVDWGVAKLLDGALDGHADRDGDPDALVTRAGQIVGTPAYMSPEQAAGDPAPVDARSDVYSLGAVLFEILAGARPYNGPTVQVLNRLLNGPTADLPAQTAGGAPIPEDLARVVRRAMARDPEDRYRTASALGDEVAAWLDDARRQERARALTQAALAEAPRAAALRQQAETLQLRAAEQLAAVPAWGPAAAKAPGWALQDAATHLLGEARLVELDVTQRLLGALMVDPGWLDAHEALLARDLDAFHAAEAARDDAGRDEAQARVTHRLAAFPAGHPLGERVRARVERTLRGEGALTLHTEPAGAEVLLHRYEPRARRLEPVFERALGRTPLDAVPLPMGSYLCVIRHEGFSDVAYPVRIGREAHWHGVPPGGTRPEPVRLLAAGALRPDEVYVPAGWFEAGGDPEVTGFPALRVWADGFVVQRHPVTFGEYLAYLDHLVATGRVDEAMERVPKERGGDGYTACVRLDGGRFVIVPDVDGDLRSPRWPIFDVDWWSARAYLSWRAARDGRPWRLPAELEWEKAARGVDGRWYPWGDFLDPSWCCIGASHADRRQPVVVDAFPGDVSPYGARGLGGNVEDWCLDLYDRPTPAPGRLVVPEPADEPHALRVLRGGMWAANHRYARSAYRHGNAPSARSSGGSFRGVWSL